MPEVPDGLRDIAERVGVGALLDVLLISLAIYWLLLLLRGTTAMTVLRGVSLLLLGAFLLARTFDLQVVNWMLERTITGLVIGIVIVFHPEIRRALERLGRTGWRPSLMRAEQERGIEQVVRSAVQLAKQSHGALIVLERETGLQEVIDTGVPLGAELAAETLGSIFTPGAPLHDGAAVVRANRIVAAGCTLPLAEASGPAHAVSGMRHRAAVGITEASDALVVVVSEERGEVSVASHGRMLSGLDERRLHHLLLRLFGLSGAAAEDAAGSPAASAAGAPQRPS